MARFGAAGAAAVQGRCLGLVRGPATRAAPVAFRILLPVLPVLPAAAPSLPGVGTAAREANHSLLWSRQARSSLGACYRRPTVGGVDRTLFYLVALCRRVAPCRGVALCREASRTTEATVTSGEPFALPPWPHRRP